MTYQKPPTQKHDDDVKVEEATSLLSGQGEGGVPAGKKKPGVPTRRALIVTTCFLLGTLAVIYYGGRGRSSSTASSGGLAADLLRKADDTVYDPSQSNCYKDNDTAGHYCWYPTGNFPCESGHWDLEYYGRAYNDCGRKCTQVYLTADNVQGYTCVSVVYVPSEDFCFTDNDYDGQYCWDPTDNTPHGNWELKGGRGFDDCGPKCGPCNNNENFRFNDDPEHGCNNWVWVDPEMHCDKVDPITNKPVKFYCPQFCEEKCKTRAYDPSSDSCFNSLEDHDDYLVPIKSCWNSFYEIPYPTNEWVFNNLYDECGPMCTCGPECKELRQFDPKPDHCYFDAETNHKNCWYPTTGYEPIGDWVEINYAYTTINNEFNCGLKCTEVHAYDPTQDFCFHDKDNTWKYCWYPTDRMPSGNWEGKGGRGYNGCGPKCIYS